MYYVNFGQAGLLNRGETEMRGPTVVKKICVESWQALTQVSDCLAGLGVRDTVWTHAVKSELCAAGLDLGYYVCTSGVAQADHGEWLFDQVWMNWTPTPRQLERIGLVVECEWSRTQAEIFDDFEKLLVARADVRLMIFQAPTAEEVADLFARLRTATQGFSQHQSGDYYMLAGYDRQARQFLRDGFLINDALAVEDVPFLSRD